MLLVAQLTITMSASDNDAANRVDVITEAQDIGFVWNEFQENNVKDWGELALYYSLMHRKAGQYYETWYNRIGLPVTVVTSVVAMLQFATISNTCSGDGNNTTDWVNILSGLLAVIAACLSGAHNFLGLHERFQQHFAAMAAYDALFMEVVEQLAYPRVRRYNVKAFIRYIKQTLRNLKKIAPDIPERLLEDVDVVRKEHRPIQINPMRTTTASTDPVEVVNAPHVVIPIQEEPSGNDDDDGVQPAQDDLQDEFALEIKRRREMRENAEKSFYADKLENIGNVK